MTNEQKKSVELTLSNKVVVEIKPIDATVYLEVISQLQAEAPRPPMTYIERLKTYQPNYDHPDYQRDIEKHNLAVTQRISELILLEGIEVTSIPEGFPDEKSKEFKTRMRTLRFDFPDETERHLGWLKFMVLRNSEDLGKVLTEATRLSGVSEKDVANADQLFPDKS
jgi:hypothetical protein